MTSYRELASTPLGRVLYRTSDQAQHMIVRKRVKDVLGIASPDHEAYRKERLQARRHGSQLLPFQLGQLRYAEFAPAEPNQNPQALRISQRAQHGGCRGQVIALRQRSCDTRWVRAMVVGGTREFRAQSIIPSIYETYFDWRRASRGGS